MKKTATNKMTLKEEVNALLKKSESKREVRSFAIILAFNGKYKVDRYTFGLRAGHDERKNFSLSSLTEAEARTILSEPNTFPVIFQNGKTKDPAWLEEIPGYRVEVPVNESEMIDVERFFNHEYEPIDFLDRTLYAPIPNGHFNYWDHQNDPDIKWWGSEGRKLWQKVTALWMKVIEDREEKATM